MDSIVSVYIFTGALVGLALVIHAFQVILSSFSRNFQDWGEMEHSTVCILRGYHFGHSKIQ